MRGAAARDPAAALPQFIAAAIEHAGELAGGGGLDVARAWLSEARAQPRRLAADDPDTNMAVPGHVLVLSAESGHSADPAAEAAEAVSIYRPMIGGGDRDDLHADLALALKGHADSVRAAGRNADSRPESTEAAGLLGPLTAEDRWTHTPYLSTALGGFAETAARRGDPEQAVAAAREAIDLEVSRTNDVPPTPAERLPRLRRILRAALFFPAAKSRQSMPPAVMAVLVAEIRETAQSLPAGTLADADMLAGALAAPGTGYAGAGQPEDAAPQFAEALDALRGGDGGRREPEPLLFMAGESSLLSAYSTLGKHAEAARAAAEMLAGCRRAQPRWEQHRYQCALAISKVMAPPAVRIRVRGPAARSLAGPRLPSVAAG